MGFGVENVLIRGRPPSKALEAWVRAALPRLKQPELQFPGESRATLLTSNVLLNAAGRLQVERPHEFTVLWLTAESSALSAEPDNLLSFGPLRRLLGIKRRDPLEWSPLHEGARLPPLPVDRAGADAVQRNAFLLTLALLAKAEGHDSAFFADGSVSDSGCLFVPGGDAIIWSDVDCDAQRERADEVLRKTFAPIGPDLEELQWVGPGDAFWSRPLVEAGRRVESLPETLSSPSSAL